jgi:sulfide:quinone oxidoreductase
MSKPKILVLGGNFAGLASAQNLRRECGNDVDITVIDRKSYLLIVPNIPGDVFEDRDPALRQRMDLVEVLDKDGIAFLHAEVRSIDVDAKKVEFVPAERPGAETESLPYDYLVVALGNRLAYDKVEGFAAHGFSVGDIYHANRLRHYLSHEYRGGPIAIGSARFHQGDGAKGLEPYPGGSIPDALAACEGPPVEVMLSMATWLKNHDKGGPDKVTVFTPADLIAEDAGEEVVHKLLDIAGGMGFNYVNKGKDITRLTAEGVELASGQTIESEISIIFPDWVPHDFLRDLPIADSEGFIKTDLKMRNPDYPEVFAAGDCAAVVVPKLGAIGHQTAEIAAKGIAADLGHIDASEVEPLKPVVYCIGDMGDRKAFYIRSNSWFGGDTQVLKMGHTAHFLKEQYRHLFFMRDGKMPSWGLDAAEALQERIVG